MTIRAKAWALVDIAPLALYGVLAVALFSGAWSDPSRTLVGVPADSVLVLWTMTWVAHAIAGGHSLLYSYAVGYPGGVNLLSTTAVTLAGIVLSPITWLFGPMVSYNVLATGAIVLSGWCAYLCLRRYARGRTGPLVGGLVFGFSPPLVAQSYGHPQITTAFLVPLLVILIDEALVRRPAPVAPGPVAPGPAYPGPARPRSLPPDTGGVERSGPDMVWPSPGHEPGPDLVWPSPGHEPGPDLVWPSPGHEPGPDLVWPSPGHEPGPDLVWPSPGRKPVPSSALGATIGLLLTAQLLLSSEVLATEVMMGAVVVVVLALLHPRGVKRCAGRAVRVGATALGVFAALGARPLYVELAGKGHTVGGAIRGLDTYVTNLANLIAPTAVQALGPAGISRHFAGGLVEADGYLGIPLLVVLGWALWRCRRVSVVPVAGLVGLVALVLSLGPRLEVGARVTGIPLPWAVLDHLPLLRDALPSRLAVYVDLAAVVILAVWLGEIQATLGGAATLGGRSALRRLLAGRRGGLHSVGGAATGPARRGATDGGALVSGRAEVVVSGVGVALILASLFPAIPFPSYHPPVPPFFASARSSAAIRTGSVAVLLPLDSSSSLLWQALSGMRFSMPENHFGTGPQPAPPLGGPLTTALLNAQATGALPAASASAGLRTGFAEACVTSVAAGPMPHESAVISLVRDVLGSPPRHVGGVYLWQLSDDAACAPKQ